ncbi:GreA/GreB family elongation factor [Pseudomonas entomophila]|uniref:GreA/GreB family elongation factor n=1 Tax=Pseudomonas entomophila TaxID=312306 RepID=UPI003EB6F6CD
MSRAFVNEDQAAAQANPPVERRISDQPNQVTASGYAQLQQRVAELSAQRSALLAHGDAVDTSQVADSERDLRYFTARLQSAQVVPAPTPGGKVQIGNRVRFLDEDSVEHAVQLVGEDEADAAQGRVNWGSPLGRALLGAAEGDEVTWRRPAGDQTIEIVAIE